MFSTRVLQTVSLVSRLDSRILNRLRALRYVTVMLLRRWAWLILSNLVTSSRIRPLIRDHSFHCIDATCNNPNGHKWCCSKLISATKALQFVTFLIFLYLPENAGEHQSKGNDHIYRVHISWSEWSRTMIFHCTFSTWSG